MKIVRYALDARLSREVLKVPSIRYPLCVLAIADNLAIYYNVNPDAAYITCTLYLVRTGETVPSDTGRHLGSVQLRNTEVHVFEAPNAT